MLSALSYSALASALLTMPSAVAQTSRPTASQPTANAWRMFRGDPQQTGVAHAKLPDTLVVRWKTELPDAIEGSAAIVNGVTYVGCDDEHVYAIDLRDGKTRWKYKAKGAVQASVSVLDGVVYVGDEDGVMHAIDAASGKAKWTFQTDGQIMSSVNYDKPHVLFGSYDGYLYCLDAATGALVWKYESADRLHGTPTIVDRRALVAGCDGMLHVVDVDTGKLDRQVDLQNVCGASAATIGDKVYLGTYGESVLGLDWKVGRIDWTYEHPKKKFPYLSSAAVTRKRIFVGGRDKLMRALDPKTGKSLWEFPTKGRVESSPVVVGGRLFFGSYDGNLYALSVTSGKELWRYETGSPISASPAVAGGTLVIGTLDGVLYCFARRKPTQ